MEIHIFVAIKYTKINKDCHETNNNDARLCTQVLYRLGFDWSPTSWDYVERMLTAIGGFGFFE
jgi:hypothetical protein